MVMAVCGTSSLAFAADGTITFDGEVIDAACTISTSSQAQSIDLGKVDSSILSAASDKSAEVPFSIALDNCNPAVATTATVGFTGTTDTTVPTALANLETDGAKHVAVQISAGGTIIPVDGTFSTNAQHTLSDGSNSIDFSAYMIATDAAATAGAVHSTVDFSIQYE